jgi:hypothetical protein
MKKKIYFALLAGFAILSTQQVQAHTKIVIAEAPPQYVMVQTAPPAEMVEDIGPSPGPDFLWIKGNWRWDGRWVWNRGHWYQRPHPEAVWAPGVWVRKTHHHVWVAGRWE